MNSDRADGSARSQSWGGQSELGPTARAAIFLVAVGGLSAFLTWAEAGPLIPLLVGILVLVYATTPVWYETAPSHLKIKQGIWTSQKVRYADISRVLETEIPGAVTGPKTAIEVQFTGRVVRVSPRDRAGFFAALASRCPHLHPYGMELRPGSATGDLTDWSQPPRPRLGP